MLLSSGVQNYFTVKKSVVYLAYLNKSSRMLPFIRKDQALEPYPFPWKVFKEKTRPISI